MMTETETETGIQEKCIKCDAEIRPGSQFCYGCGEPVGEIDVSSVDSNVVEFPRSKNAEEETDIPDDFLVPEEAPIEEPTPQTEKLSDMVVEPVELPKDRKRHRNERMETAASIKQRERLRVKKPVEIVWDRPESSWPFAVASVVFLVVAVVIFYFAIYSK